jgi:hypothetical protein
MAADSGSRRSVEVVLSPDVFRELQTWIGRPAPKSAEVVIVCGNRPMTRSGLRIVPQMRRVFTALFLAACILFAGCGPSGSNEVVSSDDSDPTPPAGFVLTGSMNLYRSGHTATLLDDGTVLVEGGGYVVAYDPGILNGAGQPEPVDQPWGGCEIYTPTSGVFELCAPTDLPVYGHTATRLNDGTVLIAGGEIIFPVRPPNYFPTESYLSPGGEVYSPALREFSPTGSLNTPRKYHTATLLSNGMVLIVGGYDAAGNPLASAELFNPASETFTLTGSLNFARAGHTATLLGNGMVLIAGGSGPGTTLPDPAELYDPETGSFSVTGSLNAARTSHTATLLNDGTVLIAGGLATGNALASQAEIYNPTTGVFTGTGSLNSGRQRHTATLLPDGTVLIAGGSDVSYNALSSAELYKPATGTFTSISGLNFPRYSHTATLLGNGSVLLAGGSDPVTGTGYAAALSSAELY